MGTGISSLYVSKGINNPFKLFHKFVPSLMGVWTESWPIITCESPVFHNGLCKVTTHLFVVIDSSPSRSMFGGKSLPPKDYATLLSLPQMLLHRWVQHQLREYPVMSVQLFDILLELAKLLEKHLILTKTSKASGIVKGPCCSTWCNIVSVT